MLEKIPFLHGERAYNIIIEDDLTFDAAHYIIDYLLDEEAFDLADDMSDVYTIQYGDTTYTIGVDGMDVVITMHNPG